MIPFTQWLANIDKPRRLAEVRALRNLKAVKKACGRMEKGKRGMKGIRAKSVKVVRK